MTSYLTFEEFTELTDREVAIDLFDRYYKKAASVLDNITNNFYQVHSIENDPIEFRVKKFKLALCAQIIYFYEAGGDSNESLNKTPQSFSAGRTSISNKSTENGKDKPLVAEDVYIYLESTGLLYRGVLSC